MLADCGSSILSARLGEPINDGHVSPRFASGPIDQLQVRDYVRLPGRRAATHGNDVGLSRGVAPAKSPKQSEICRRRCCRSLPDEAPGWSG